MNNVKPNGLGRALRGFLTDHLPKVRGASPHTVRSYRDAFSLLLRFLATQRGRPAVLLDLDDLATEDILAFLEHLETDRDNGVATRNSRLAAIHAFARYAAAGHPEHLEQFQRLLAVPFKRAPIGVVDYLDAKEIGAILDAPDLEKADGRRDRTLFQTLFNTGARVQELLDLRPCDLQLVRPFQIRLFGKGRRERLCPLWPQTVDMLRSLLIERGVNSGDSSPLFRNRRGEPITRFGVRYLLSKYARLATSSVSSLELKRVHPHTIRHSTAVHLLQAGVDLVTISHWLGHASIETTNRYVAVDLETKRLALARAQPLGEVVGSISQWRTDASVLDWLEAL